ncbi:MAG: CopG family transcriptional regulator [Pygmaiobacter sp.]
MGKTVYSVVLTEEVVAAVDALAYREGISRSRLIDRILAQYACCDTPARQMADIFAPIEQMVNLHGRLQLLLQPTEELLQLKSAVPYKYNPTVKYAVELHTASLTSIGELRVTLRSQSAGLLCAMNEFYSLWAGLEERFFEDGAFLTYEAANGRYLRVLRRPKVLKAAELGDAIAGYIDLFDAVMKGYFDALPSKPDAVRRAVAVFEKTKHNNILGL